MSVEFGKNPTGPAPADTSPTKPAGDMNVIPAGDMHVISGKLENQNRPIEFVQSTALTRFIESAARTPQSTVWNKFASFFNPATKEMSLAKKGFETKGGSIDGAKHATQAILKGVGLTFALPFVGVISLGNEMFKPLSTFVNTQVNTIRDLDSEAPNATLWQDTKLALAMIGHGLLMGTVVVSLAPFSILAGVSKGTSMLLEKSLPEKQASFVKNHLNGFVGDILKLTEDMNSGKMTFKDLEKIPASVFLAGFKEKEMTKFLVENWGSLPESFRKDIQEYRDIEALIEAQNAEATKKLIPLDKLLPKVNTLIEFMSKNLGTEGLYRQPGNLLRQDELYNSMQSDNLVNIPDETTINEVSFVLKRAIRDHANLNDDEINQIYEIFREDNKDLPEENKDKVKAEQISNLKSFFGKIPAEKREIYKEIFLHLQSVIQAQRNLPEKLAVSSNSLGLLWMPNFFASNKSPNPKKEIGIIEFLIDNASAIFG